MLFPWVFILDFFFALAPPIVFCHSRSLSLCPTALPWTFSFRHLAWPFAVGRLLQTFALDADPRLWSMDACCSLLPQTSALTTCLSSSCHSTLSFILSISDCYFRCVCVCCSCCYKCKASLKCPFLPSSLFVCCRRRANASYANSIPSHVLSGCDVIIDVAV